MPQNQKGRYYPPLIEAYLLENNLDKAVENLIDCLNKEIELDSDAEPVLTKIFMNLVQNNDFDTICKIVTTFNKVRLNFYKKCCYYLQFVVITLTRFFFTQKTTKNIPMNLILNTCYFETGKYKDYITYLESMLEDPTKRNVAINLMFHNTVAAKAMLDNAEVEEKCEYLTQKILTKININLIFFFYSEEVCI